MMKTKCTRFLALLMVFVLILGMFPGTTWAAFETTDPEASPPDGAEDVAVPLADQGSIPGILWDNDVLRALQYLGYDVNYLKDHGILYNKTEIAKVISTIKSNIPYTPEGSAYGRGTVDDPTTYTGKAPNVAAFERMGLVCGGFVTYYMYNYLPNIEGRDTSYLDNVSKTVNSDGNGRAASHWYITLNRATKSEYKTAKYGYDKNPIDVTEYDVYNGTENFKNKDAVYAALQPGDIVVFVDPDTFDKNNKAAGAPGWSHVAVYIGAYNGYHWIAHCGNANGPELAVMEGRAGGADGKGKMVPLAFFHIEIPHQEGYIEVNKKDPNGNDLAGAQFLATNQITGSQYPIGPSDSNGYAISKALPLGTYTVTETKAPDGYQRTEESWTVTLTGKEPNGTVSITVVNQAKLSGSITLKKVDAVTKAPLAGAQFILTYVDAGWINGNAYVSGKVRGEDKGEPETGSWALRTTGSDGIVEWTGLKPGEYCLVEYTAPAGYLNDPIFKSGGQELERGNDLVDGAPRYYTKITINEGTAVQIEAQDPSIPGTIEIVKTTTDGSSVEGWTFKVTDSTGKEVKGSPFTTDATGKIVQKLTPGTYTVEEMIPEGSTYHCVGQNPQQVTVEAGKTGTVKFVNAPDEGYIQIVKTTTDGSTVKGWQFKVTDAAGKPVAGSPFTTNAQGVITTGKLTPGTYTVEEIIPANRPYHCVGQNPQQVTVEAGKTGTVKFVNAPNPGTIEIVKTTTDGSSVEGWQFKVMDASGNAVTGSPFTTNAQGVITTGKLTPGTYIVKEVIPANRPYHCVGQNPQTVTVKPGETGKVTFVNAPNPGTIEIVKTTTDGSSVEGWTFKVTDATGKAVTGSPFTTNAQGTITTGKLTPGTYNVEEIIPANRPYHCVGQNPQQVTVEAGKTGTVKFVNAPNPGTIEIVKTTTDGSSVEGWQFKVMDASGKPVAGSPFTTDESGKITKQLVPGTYTVEEMIPEGSFYQCDSENPQTVTVTPGQTAQVSFTNSPIPVSIHIRKVDMNGKPLAGATFLLEWTADGAEWQSVVYALSGAIHDGNEGEVVSADLFPGGCTSPGLKDGRLTSGEDGLVTFTGLYPGLHYRLTEVAAPDGYTMLTEPAYEGVLVPGAPLDLQVVNSPGYLIPDTGASSLVGAAFVGSMNALFGCAGLVSLLRRKKKT